jgi:hypothetical protein
VTCETALVEQFCGQIDMTFRREYFITGGPVFSEAQNISTLERFVEEVIN